MAHYVDLEPCDYIRFNPARRHLVIAVGWLEPDFEFPRSDAPSAFVDALLKLTETNTGNPRHMMMGHHDCALAHSAQPDGSIAKPEFPSSSCKELYIPFRGCLFVSPENVGHYVTVHGYAPPQQFAEAVEHCPEFRSDDYHEQTHRFFRLTNEDLGPVPKEVPWR
jgi:hypothetical protein